MLGQVRSLVSPSHANWSPDFGWVECNTDTTELNKEYIYIYIFLLTCVKLCCDRP